MLGFTGDCHGNFERLNEQNFPEQKEMTKEDYVIICGDFGGVWHGDKENERENRILDWLESRPFTTLFVDGNHENFDRLKEYPVEIWNGGKVHKIRPSVIHLMRGQVFQIDGKKIFTFGGAQSHDIPYRTNHLSWWAEEMPSEEEMDEGIRNLEENGNQVDYIVSHCCASSTLDLLSHGRFKKDYLSDYLEKIRQNVQFKKWFFGHYHYDIQINAEEYLLYGQIARIL